MSLANEFLQRLGKAKVTDIRETKGSGTSEFQDPLKYLLKNKQKKIPNTVAVPKKKDRTFKAPPKYVDNEPPKRTRKPTKFYLETIELPQVKVDVYFPPPRYSHFLLMKSKGDDEKIYYKKYDRKKKEFTSTEVKDLSGDMASKLVKSGLFVYLSDVPPHLRDKHFAV